MSHLYFLNFLRGQLCRMSTINHRLFTLRNFFRSGHVGYIPDAFRYVQKSLTFLYTVQPECRCRYRFIDRKMILILSLFAHKINNAYESAYQSVFDLSCNVYRDTRHSVYSRILTKRLSFAVVEKFFRLWYSTSKKNLTHFHEMDRLK